MTPNNPEQSNCCKAPIKATHGCDDDFLHGGKKCTCEIVTSWYVCEKCKHPCDPLVAEMVEVSKIGTDSPVFTKAFQERLKPECQLCKKPVNYAEAAHFKGEWYCRKCTLHSPDTLNTCQKHVKAVHVEGEIVHKAAQAANAEQAAFMKPTERWEEREEIPEHLKDEFEPSFDMRSKWFNKWCNEESEFHIQNPINLKKQILLEDLERLTDEAHERGKREELDRIKAIIENYKKWTQGYREDCHPDNLQMLMYDASSREIACSHILKNITTHD